MRGGFAAALVVLVVCAPAHAQTSWDLEKCRADAPAGHLCTSEHLETDLALLTAREISTFLDPENQALELLIRRDPQTHIRNPEASLPDPRTDPTYIQLLHAWAESGLIESEAPTRRGTGTTALRGIKRLSVTVEDAQSRDARCRPAIDALRLAATRPIIDGGLKVVPLDFASPALYVSVTALPIDVDRCAAFLSVSLRDLPYVTPGYQQPPKTLGRKILDDGSLLTNTQPAFTRDVTDQLRRTVDDFVNQIKSANRIR